MDKKEKTHNTKEIVALAQELWSEEETLPSWKDLPAPNLTEAPRLGERYQLGEEVARGGLGRILRAHDKHLGRVVALKERMRGGLEAEERFLREALITAKLEHPAIIPVYDFGRKEDGTSCYMMKMVAGSGLDQVIAKTNKTSERLALLPHFITVCEAVSYAHSKKIIHRDLKPQNILIGEFGEVLVIDWGIAKELDLTPARVARHPSPQMRRMDGGEVQPPYREEPSDANLTKDGAVLGTPAYMPPEQARGEPLDERADVYALGAILYHLLSGAPPYRGGNLDILRALLSKPPQPLGDQLKDLPKDLLAIVQKAMARDAKDRYPSAKELTEDLKKFQTGQLVGVHSYTKWELFRRFYLKYRAAFFVLSMALFVFQLLIFFSFRRVVKERRKAQEARLLAEESKKSAEEALLLSQQQQKELKAAHQQLSHREEVLLLREVERTLETDPTRALAILQSWNPGGKLFGTARTLAQEATGRGVAMHILSASSVINEQLFSPDGKMLATLDPTPSVRLWEVESGALLETFEAHLAAFSPDGSAVALASKEGVRVVDLRTKKERLSIQEKGAAQLVFSSEGLLLSLSGGVLSVYDAASGARVSSTPAQYCFRVSPDGTQVALHDPQGRAVELRSLPALELLQSIPSPQTESTLYSCPTFSPDGTKLAEESKAEIFVWSLTQKKKLLSFSHKGAPYFSPDGSVLALSTQEDVLLFDASTGALLQTLAANAKKAAPTHIPRSIIAPLAFVSKGKYLLSGGSDGVAKLWEVKTGALLKTLSGHRSMVLNVSASPDQKYLATGSADQSARLWRLEPLLPKETLQKMASVTATFSPDRTLAAVRKNGATHEIKLFEVASGRLLRTFTLPLIAGGIAISADHKRLAVGTLDSARQDNIVQLWDIATGEPLRSLPIGDYAFSIAFSPDQKTLAVSNSAKTTVSLWNTETGALIKTLSDLNFVMSLHFSNDGKTLLVGGGLRLLALDIETGKERWALVPHKGAVVGIALSPDGQTLATAGQGGSLKLWDLKTGRLLRSWEDLDPERTYFLSFSPDGQTIAVSGLGGSLTLCDIASGTHFRWFSNGETSDGPLPMTFLSSDELLVAHNEGLLRVQDPRAKDPSGVLSLASRVTSLRILPDEL